MQIVIIGGGAAGFFAAIHAASANPKAKVMILEKTSKLLAKVRISGGGRCNVTHSCFSISEMSKHYPRGERQMKQLLHQFMTTDTIAWFESRNVKLKTEDDGRMFPVTDSSETIIDCLFTESKKLGIEIRLNTDIISIEQVAKLSEQTRTTAEQTQIRASEPHQILPSKVLILKIKNQPSIHADRVIVATGGSPKESGLQWLKGLGHEIELPVPSLFTFNIPHNPIVKLMGASVPYGRVKIQGSKLEAEGAILVTHWGLSGPAILRLSAWGARELAEKDYHFKISMNWLGKWTEDGFRNLLNQHKNDLAKKLVTNCNPSYLLLPESSRTTLSVPSPITLPNRLWEFLLEKVEIPFQKKWAELSKNELNRLINALVNDEYEVKGKTTFKEEFVTCGGVSFKSIDLQTMQSKAVPHLYFAGEILDIDGITGGFNFQAAWTTGFVAGTSAGRE
jgi:predicted flavoprotein YhiN